MERFDLERVRDFYDGYGIREWERYETTAHSRLIYHLHWHFLKEHLRPGQSVLDAGAGAGRFSIAMADVGCRVTLLDLSAEQLAIARAKVAEASVAVAGYARGDARRLPFRDAAFDTTVCFGAVLNYLFDDAEAALDELIRVTRPGGTLLVGVSSRWGVLRFVTGSERVDAADFLGRPEYWHLRHVIETGDLPAHPRVPQPPRHFFESGELIELLTRAGLSDLQIASAPSVTAALYARLELMEPIPAAWQTVLEIEERAYRRPGLHDAGEWLLASGHVG